MSQRNKEREREMVKQTVNGRGRARLRRQRNKELNYFALLLIILVNSAIGAHVSLSPSVLKPASVVRVNRASAF